MVRGSSTCESAVEEVVEVELALPLEETLEDIGWKAYEVDELELGVLPDVLELLEGEVAGVVVLELSQ